MLNKIILGTANFTQQYGILASQQMCSDEGKNILKGALNSGIGTLDTAFGYGNIFQENVVKLLKSFTINTKFSVLERPEVVYESLKQLASYNIDILMVHDPQHLHKADHAKVLSLLHRLKQEGLICRIGVSVYDQEEVQLFCNQLCQPDVIQLPLNPLNQTFKNPTFLEFVQNHSIEVHARSLFLQGIILTKELPLKFAPIKDKIESVIEQLSIYPSRLNGLLAWAQQQKWVDKWVLGVSDHLDLNEIVSEIARIPKHLAVECQPVCHSLLDPRTW